MASCAVDTFGFAMHVAGVDVLGDGGVTIPASRFCHLPVKVRDLNNVWILPGGEMKRMKEPIAGFHRIFSDHIVGRVAVIARGCRTMAGFNPAAVLIIHHVAVGAGAGLVLQI